MTLLAKPLPWLLPLALAGCAAPAQRGGLGVFNPNGFEGRMALASRANGHALGGTVSYSEVTKPDGPAPR